jgi:chemotaxis protein histidine kinase CheA
MSGEFIKVATKEINDEIASIQKILESSKNDSDISKKCESIEKHFHKIKGLAPMMGKKDIGEISVLDDILLNCIKEGKNLDGIYSILRESTVFMSNSMQGKKNNPREIIQKIKTKYSKYLD